MIGFDTGFFMRFLEGRGNMQTRVERHIIIQSKHLEEICHKSKNLYNYVNYLVRQHFFKTREVLDEYELTIQLAKEDQIDYRELPAQTSQQVIKLLFKNWKSFLKANYDYNEHPEKYKKRPRIPGYKKKDGLNIVIFTNQQCRLKDGYIQFPQASSLPPLKTKVDNLHQVRITPQATCFVIEVVYHKEEIKAEVEEDNFLSVDLGLSNLVTTINNVGEEPFIINGRIIKSYNRLYNKLKVRQQAFIGEKGTSKEIKRLTFRRNNKVSDYLHKVSRYIIDYCIEHKLGTIVIGNNKDWKQEIKLGKVNNQNFVSIPFERLISMIEYKAIDVGIKVTVREESYTSKVDHLAYETMEHHESYIGKRIKRGLFKSSTGKLINADVNGAIGIARKVFGDSVIKTILDSGAGLVPVKVNII